MQSAHIKTLVGNDWDAALQSLIQRFVASYNESITNEIFDPVKRVQSTLHQTMCANLASSAVVNSNRR